MMFKLTFDRIGCPVMQSVPLTLLMNPTKYLHPPLFMDFRFILKNGVVQLRNAWQKNCIVLSGL